MFRLVEVGLCVALVAALVLAWQRIHPVCGSDDDESSKTFAEQWRPGVFSTTAPLAAASSTAGELPLDQPRIVVRKAARRLELCAGEVKLREYRIGLGSNPTGDKVQAGDGRTPEGVFHICSKNARGAYCLSLGDTLSIRGRGSERDGTQACVALDDADMRELFFAVAEGTAVVVAP